MNVSGTLFFDANDGVHGYELWRSGGTAQTTSLVKDINPGPANGLGVPPGSDESLVNANGTLFFSANDGVHGRQLWESNGTAAGTIMVQDINPGPAGSYPQYMTNNNGTLFFSANDGVFGQEPWILGPLPTPPSGAGAAPQLVTAVSSVETDSLATPLPSGEMGKSRRCSQRPPDRRHSFSGTSTSIRR